MSLHGLMTGRKSTEFAIARASETRGADGATIETVAATGATVRGLADGITAELAALVFGERVRVELRLLVPLDADVRDNDRLLALAGPLVGQRFRVTRRQIANTRPRTAHAECALVTTVETW